MNESKHIDPKDCLGCGTCCKHFSMAYNKEKLKESESLRGELQRFELLKTNKIWVEEDEVYKFVIFDYPCKELIETKGRFGCKIYSKGRPLLCKEYPWKETTDCPHIKNGS